MALEFDLDKEPVPDMIKVDPIPPQGGALIPYEKNYVALKTDLDRVKSAITLMENKLNAISVVDDQTHTLMSEIWNAAKTMLLDLEKKRVSVVEEPRLQVKKIQDLCNSVKDPLMRIKSTAHQKVNQYKVQLRQDEQDRQEKARKERERLQAQLDKDAKEKNLPGVIVPEVVVEAQTRIRTEKGTTSFDKKVRKWEVSDFGLIPSKYLQTNDKMINSAVKGGNDDIPGLRIWEDIETGMRGGRS
jgi:hypothetical protein